MKNLNKALALVVSVLTFQLTGCGTAKVSPPSDELSSNAVSSVEIEYALGHYQHRFTADGGAGRAQVTTYLERDVVEHASVDPAKYEAFVAKAIAFSEKPKRAPTQEAECRSPFKILVKIQFKVESKPDGKNSEKTYTSHGCRSFDDEGALSRLVRDGEFLLFGKK